LSAASRSAQACGKQNRRIRAKQGVEAKFVVAMLDVPAANVLQQLRGLEGCQQESAGLWQTQQGGGGCFEV
jgi:hypothetical protein